MKTSVRPSRPLCHPVLLLLLLLPTASIISQTAPQDAEELIEQSLRIVDLPSFEWNGQPDPMHPRLGIYSNQVPADTARVMPGFPPATTGFSIWHIMPHWSADEAGLYIGDIILAMNGRPIGDSAYNGDEYMSVVARDMQPGDTARFTILRNGVVREIPVPLKATKRTPMPFLSVNSSGMEADPFGPTRSDSWLARTLAEKGLTGWADTIGRQMRIVADQDFSTAPFTDRPSPWRLRAVTYLHRHPTRVAAYARRISQDMWNGTDGAPGLSGAVWEATRHLDIASTRANLPSLPGSLDELTPWLRRVQSEIDEGYAPIRPDLASMTRELVEVLDMNGNWEESLDSIADPVKRRDARNREEGKLVSLFGKADQVDMRALGHAAEMLAGLADTTWLRTFIASLPTMTPLRRQVPGVEGEVLRVWDTPFGRCVIGGPGPNRYTGEFRFILDLGGDDTYELPPVPVGTFRYAADMEGNDVYTNSGSGQGCGIGSIDVLVDRQGDDTYRSTMYSQGAGLLGVGVLADFGGDDIYTSRWCSQGAAFLGIGLLYDGGGSDNYVAEIYSQGFGYVHGFGAILEESGNDSYRAGWKYPDSRYPGRAHLALSQGFGYGMRPWTTGVGADGGIGLLDDRHGHDIYASDFFSQGGSYWYALGILHDAEGCDRYTAGQYSQGSGIHLSFGALLDDAGDDMYDAYHGLEQGNAHDWSAGCLEDLQGNDTYRGSTASQGCALNVAVAWLLDYGGDDQYYVKASDTTSNQGGGNFNRPRNHGSLGLLIDLGHGDDYYVDPRGVPGRAVVKASKGILFDDGIPEKQ